MSDLPPGWVWATLGEVGTWLGGGTPSKARSAYWDDGTIPWLSPKDMRSAVLVTTQDHITQAAVDGSATRLVPAPSVAVVVRSGILEHSLPVALVQFATTLNQDMKALVPYWDSGARWIHYALTANADSILESCRKRGTTVASIEFSRFLDFKIPIAPYSEQRRIIEALEAHLSHLDAASSMLAFGQQRSVAFTQALIDSTVARGKATRVQVSALLREPLRNGHSARVDVHGNGIPTLSLTAVTRNQFDDRHIKRTTAIPSQVRDLWLRCGDIFVQRANTPDLVGTSALYEGIDNWAIFPDLLIRLRVDETLALPRFVLAALKTTSVRRYYRKAARGLAGSMPKIDQTTIARTLIPLPSLEVQAESLRFLDSATSILGRTAEEIAHTKNRGVALRRSLLAASFSGQLVPQDPDDEPAESLLKRIRAERAGEAPRARRTRKTGAAR
jgi:type I restriction enzyme S subunit